MTDALYLKDCYLQEFVAKVISLVSEKEIILDETAFYPTGGGQPCDIGKVSTQTNNYEVISVEKRDEEIIHHVDKEGLKVGDLIKGEINWQRRYALMRMHTATHLLCHSINQDNGALITGNQLGEEQTRVDLSLENLDKEKIKDYFLKTNEIILQNKEVKISFLSKQEAEKLSKLANADYEDFEFLRIIEIEGVEMQPCGGCHVKNTGEIKGIEVVSLENKGKGRKRVYFKLKEGIK